MRSSMHALRACGRSRKRGAHGGGAGAEKCAAERAHGVGVGVVHTTYNVFANASRHVWRQSTKWHSGIKILRECDLLGVV